MHMIKLAHGHIFAIPLPDETYVFGRVLFDVYGCTKRRLLPYDSPLLFLGKSYLVEMYSAVQTTPDYIPSPTLICGAFVESIKFGNEWPIIGKEPVDPRLVEFPESLSGFERGSAFECGEIRIPLPLTIEEVLRINVLKRTNTPFLWPFTCWRLLGHGDNAIPDTAKVNSVLAVR
jgi:hypothetical protein